MNFRFALGLVFLALSTSAFAMAPVTSDAGMVTIQSVSLQGGELTIRVEDKEPVTSVCHFYLARMEYLKPLQVLNLEFDSRKPCPNDQYGKRQGIFKWKLPAVVATSDLLKMVINGELAGDLKFTNGKVSLRKPKP